MMRRNLAGFLEKKVKEFNTPAFIKDDPVSVPHRFSKKQDIEIAGFFAASFAWGNRPVIIRKCMELMQLMDNAPYDFIRHHRETDLRAFTHFRHRTFNPTDLLYFIQFLQHHYRRHESLEPAFYQPHFRDITGVELVETCLVHFHHYFFSLEDAPARTRKHVATPEKRSNCKRLNMYLRWMVRNDTCGVDFGLWKGLRPSDLICPVDLHVARVARRFGILQRKQVDWSAALELTRYLRTLDASDPAKYDFALFGLGVLEKFT